MRWANVDEEEESELYSCDDMSISDKNDNCTDYDTTTTVQPQFEDTFEGEDSDTDADIPRAHGPKTTSERRRAQNDILKAFAANITAHVTQQEVEEATSKSANEEQLSIRDILAKQETAVRITNPRDYQTELFQIAKSRNIIAVLDTGSGKTHIATLLLKHVLDEELESRAKGNPHRTAFFLVSMPSACITKLTPLRWTRSTSSFSKRTFSAAVLIKASNQYAVLWVPVSGADQHGKRTSPRTWSLYAPRKSSHNV